MTQPVKSPYLVPFDGSFRVKDARTAAPRDVPPHEELAARLTKAVARIAELQRLLYAHDRHAVLLVFQAMDAAGKDGTIRAVLQGVDPTGCQVFSFKAPSAEELDHDFLWRTAKCLPERGRIGVFNRSWYEEVLVVRVHPEILAKQRLPESVPTKHLWEHRFESIHDHEKYLARNGVLILKFWLNVSKDEQRKRFLSRLAEPEKNWKFATGDVAERERWDDYMAAYEDALNATSREWAPWYAIPADDKVFMRVQVAEIVVKSLERIKLGYPEATADERAHFDEMRDRLEAEVPSPKQRRARNRR
ncbi:MAG: polyphosphate kinase 2 family protein [Planctomycetes bacterium]|nr:polyphosphate kinase 2 family protein [Planctomycetota bacterium]